MQKQDKHILEGEITSAFEESAEQIIDVPKDKTLMATGFHSALVTRQDGSKEPHVAVFCENMDGDHFVCSIPAIEFINGAAQMVEILKDKVKEALQQQVQNNNPNGNN